MNPGAWRGEFSVAIALGANLGEPIRTLQAVRPLLDEVFRTGWIDGFSPAPIAPPPSPRCRWSPLFLTEPVGGPADQPPFINAVLLVDQISLAPGSPQGDGPGMDPIALLGRLQSFEQRFGRERLERWGPRSLDLDLLWWGEQRIETPRLTLPHPRLRERSFVLAPLAAIDASFPLPAIPTAGSIPCGELLASLLPRLGEAPPARLPPRSGWPE